MLKSRETCSLYERLGINNGVECKMTIKRLVRNNIFPVKFKPGTRSTFAASKELLLRSRPRRGQLVLYYHWTLTVYLTITIKG